MTVTKIANPSGGDGNIISPYQGILRNAIINGDMRIAQRGTSFAAITHTSYGLDRWQYNKVGTSVHTITQDSDVPSSTPDLQYSQKIDCTTIDGDIAAADVVSIGQRIEGYNIAPFVGRKVVLSFWVKATKIGIYCVGLRNSAADLYYTTEYTINVTDTWEFKEIVVDFDYSSGTWDYTNGIGLRLTWALAAGTNYQGTADAWTAGGAVATSNQVNACDSTDNNFWLTGVQLHPGSVALPFDTRPYAEELRLCQRYALVYSADYENLCSGKASTSDQAEGVIIFPSAMRVAPSISYSGVSPFVVGYDGSTAPATTMTLYKASSNSTLVVVTSITGSPLTIGGAIRISLNSTGKTLIFSAEL